VRALARTARCAAALAAAALLAACSGTLEDAVSKVIPSEPSYKSSRSVPPLEVPPDLSSSTINDAMPIPEVGGAPSEITYSEYARQRNPGAGQQVAASGVLPKLANVRIEREGDKRWLVIDAEPAQVWPRVRDFWLSQGFLIALEDPSIGIMETDWAEKRENFRTGISKFLANLSSALYGAATRDKFRTRLERGTRPGTTEVYISHRGAEEIVKEINRKRSEDLKVWQPRPSDPELEAEMLQRLMLYLGVERERARQMVAQSRERPSRARLVTDNRGAKVLAVADQFSRVWRRTGLALDRVGFTVEDRDRSKGLYFVRYVDPDSTGEEKKGFFSRLKFWGDGDKKEVRDAYLISLTASDGDTMIVVLDERGERVTGRTADRILGLLEQQLR